MFLLNPLATWNGKVGILLQLCYLLYKNDAASQNFSSFHHPLFLLLLVSHSFLLHQGEARLQFTIRISGSLKCTTNTKGLFMNLLHCFCFITFQTWQAEDKLQQFILHTCYHLTLCLKVKAKCSLNLLLLLDSNITAALLFVAAAAEHVYGPWSPLIGKKKTGLFWMKRKKPWSTAL